MSDTGLLQRAATIRGPELEAYREAGGRVVGYCCVATPREILLAAGLLPYRIRALGSTARELADAQMSRFNCSFCRSCLQLGLDGSYDFLDGLIETNGCDHLRGMFENWQHARPAVFFHYLRVPHLVNEDTLAVFTEELSLLRQALQQQLEVELSDDALWQAIADQGRVNDKLRLAQALRERHPPALLGAEYLALMLLESSMPLEQFEALLDRLLAERETHVATKARFRLVLAGSATDEVELVREIEALGAAVVADGLCYGSRALTASVGAADPLASLAQAYLERLLCPRMFAGYPGRLRYLEEAAGRAQVDGAILVHNKFCDLHGVENARLRLDLEARGIPVLALEKEYGSASDLGRIRTRVQAFLERLEPLARSRSGGRI